jgi:hypothetical protein
MNILLILLAKTSLQILSNHLTGDAKEMSKTGAMLEEMYFAVKQAYELQEGKPIDESKIREHKHLK